VAQIYPRALDSLFVASYESQGSGGGISNPPPHGFVNANCNSVKTHVLQMTVANVLISVSLN
jgi:hypothetical protein